MNARAGGQTQNAAPPDTPHHVDVLLQRAWEMRHEDTRQALALNRLAHEGALRIDYAGGVAYGLLRTGLCAMVLADDDDACLLQIQQAAALMRSLRDLRGESEALNLLALIHGRRNDHGRAIELAGQCLALRRRSGDRGGEAAALTNLAVELRQTHRFADALELLFAGLAIAEEIADASRCAYALCNIAGVLAETGDAQGALDHFERSLALTTRSRDRALECSNRIGIGRALAALDREAPALAQLQRALALARQTGNRADLVEALAALGRAQQQFGHLGAAQALLDEALQALRPMGDRAAESAVLCALGRNEQLRGDRPAALAHLTQALEAARAAGSETAAAQAHKLLAAAFEEGADFAAALDHFRRFYEAEQRVDGREMRRRVRSVLTQAELGPMRREAENQQRRAHELASQLDAARRAGREKEDLLGELAQQAELLEKMAREDGLTGVANRRWLDLGLARECERARRFGHPLSVAMIDVDDFKAVNDRHSHAVGDEVLRRIAHLLRDSCRASDQVGRYGGEEFLLILAETTLDNAALVCEKLCRLVQAMAWVDVHPDLAAVTVSIGLAGADAGTGCEALALTRAADTQLYRAKASGKNRVCR